jgi:hypothetical protein
MWYMIHSNPEITHHWMHSNHLLALVDQLEAGTPRKSVLVSQPAERNAAAAAGVSSLRRKAA